MPAWRKYHGIGPEGRGHWRLSWGLNSNYCTVFAKSVGIEDVLEWVDWIEKSIKKGISGKEWEELAVTAVLVGGVDRGIQDESKLCSIEYNTLECSQENSFIQDLSEGVTKSAWFHEPCLQTGVSLEGSDKTVKGCVTHEVRLSKRRGRLSERNPVREGLWTAAKAEMNLELIIEELQMILIAPMIIQRIFGKVTSTATYQLWSIMLPSSEYRGGSFFK